MRYVFSNSFKGKIFFEGSRATRVNDFSTVNGWTILLDLLEYLFPVAAALVPQRGGLRVLGTMIRYSKLVQL